MKLARTIGLAALASLLVAGGWHWWHPAPVDPVYEGKPVSEWFSRLENHGGGGIGGGDPAVRAIQALGSNAVPFLTRQLWLTSSPVHNQAIDFLNRFPRFRTISDADRRGQAFLLLAEMGPAAAGAVPDLIKLAAHSQGLSQSFAIHLLGTIHREPETVIPELEKYTASPDPTARRRAIVALGEFGPAARRSGPLLIPHLATPGREGLETAIALSKIDPQKGRAGLALLMADWSTNQNTFARARIGGAIREIDPDAARKAGVIGNGE